ncbi:hypothetical protein [Breoghania sp.]|uniref:hypothetical protein n=1 Tax=Breoghania sp. TaxID=2065378 RepID=UPI002631A0D2|nr:hypothetical protein [Breoghania sp.]MDJ0932157.1 hypothetical protein [Breoghania sp.]
MSPFTSRTLFLGKINQVFQTCRGLPITAFQRYGRLIDLAALATCLRDQIQQPRSRHRNGVFAGLAHIADDHGAVGLVTLDDDLDLRLIGLADQRLFDGLTDRPAAQMRPA